ncbi:acid response regulator transcription factor ArsR [Helicobacter mustelae]|uniref:Putative two-component system, response regulator n=1 Tax=Helicobacter mustelae (strain ATCC 43772 / CCUG 25715 / CIP 103759 / LMG 18044 / NCTC 12198 / R85-136P) TaxID=679897 RepID=D3UI54_HELM1|nr:response regulator transcription factor [Helicobacter mustelae]CBG40177.1 putative two-component system, response regulator [Helicobacter mustelae 12198]SQH71680.1 two-component system, response regulator [Helicobacter mustelae]STP12805.1 two-component system, response regulator [Helicobacter mustelae]
MLNILMIEDDIELAEILSEYLEQNDIKVTNYDEPYTGMSAIATHNYDLLLLDLTLPNLDGLEVCKRVAKQKNIPIIISSARSDLDDKVKALEYGADDYIPKPYDPKELLARIHSLLRRYNKKEVKQKEQEKDSVFRIQKDSREVFFKDKKIELTRAEYEILTLLISKKGHVFSREAIAIESESINPESSNKSIDVIIGRLRAKIEDDPKKPKYIISVRGVGYKLEA